MFSCGTEAIECQARILMFSCGGMEVKAEGELSDLKDSSSVCL